MDLDGYGNPGDISCPKGNKVDCNDNDPKVYPGAAKICDGKDNNCDGILDFTTDVDKDNDAVMWCANDCDDNNASKFPGNFEIYGTPACSDGIDNDCNNKIDNADPTCTTPCIDKDADGYGKPGTAYCPAGPQNDCNDADATINPGASDAGCDGKDNNCDGLKDEAFAPTTTNCGVGTCANTGQTTCANGIQGNTCVPLPVGVEGPYGSVNCSDGKDNNCNGKTDMADGLCMNVCIDADGDGYGSNGAAVCPVPLVADCDDSNPNINPSKTDTTCNGVDENCSGVNDEGYVPTATSCGIGGCVRAGQFACQAGAIVDTCAPGAPGTEGPLGQPSCADGIDNNCNGLTDAADVRCQVSCIDLDHDGYGNPGDVTCPSGNKVDCDDSDSLVYPGAAKICDGKDNNCDGLKDFATDEDKDHDGVPWCANDCDDNNANRFPGNTEGPYRTATCADGIDNDCDLRADLGDTDCAAPSCTTKTAPRNGVHMFDLLNPADNSTIMISCTWCHQDAQGNDMKPNCQRCHADPADAADPLNGVLKQQYPGNPPYGFATAKNVKVHSSSQAGTTHGNWTPTCLTCHNPHLQEQDARFGTTYGKYIKEYVCFNNTANGGSNTKELIKFTAATGSGSFADGPPYNENICEMCHTKTNHHQNDGTATGGQSHNDGTNCMGCHAHSDGFKASGTAPAPHDAQTCESCHVTQDTYVANANIPNSACLGCHGTGQSGSTKKVDRHYSDNYNDPTTGVLVNIKCVECHNPMSTQSNLVFIRSTIRTKAVVFTALSGANSFADGGAPYNGVCEVCHIQTEHHQADGTAPSGQSHKDGQDCRSCHKHIEGYAGQTAYDSAPAPHNTVACSACHDSGTYMFNANISNSKCNVCHGIGTTGGSSSKVDRHFSTTYNDPTTGLKMDVKCVECHNPMRAQSNQKFIRSILRGRSTVYPPFVNVTNTGVCQVCHTQTNHHQNDGTAPGGQSHNDGADCATCHPHNNGFKPNITPPPAPHATQSCTTCHVTADTYVANANIPNSACNTCHGIGTTGGSSSKVDRHFSTTYNDPTTGVMMDIKCVECHNPMSMQTNFRGIMNLKFIRSTIRGNNVAFEAYTGQYSFASDNNRPAGMLTQNYVCNTCHTQTRHHQADGTAPNGQSHNDGADCRTCHEHNKGFRPSGSCLGCHATQQGNRVAVVGQFSANSHHIQGVALTDAKCYQCHWEANSDGSINDTYHTAWNAPGSPVNLVVYGNGVRPATYTAGTTAVEYTAGALPPPAPTTPIAVVNAWVRLTTSGTGASRTAAFTAGAGTNRMAIIGLAWESSSACNPTSITGNYGGQTITTINKASSSNNLQGQWMGYIGEAGIAAKTNNTITLTFSGCTPSLTPTMSVAMYQRVSQTAPASAIASGTTGTAFSWSNLPVTANGYAMYNVSSDGIAGTFTPPVGYTERYDVATTNFRMSGGDRVVTADGTVSGTVTFSGSSPRWALVAVSINPVVVSSGTREVAKINQHCLGCHSAQNSALQPFGDGRTPQQYAWDGLSVAVRYSQTGTTAWGKYADTSTTDITPKNTQIKAYSAHGNAAANQRGWDLNESWPNTSGTGNVVCFDCHNSHGSTVDGTTTSYKSFNDAPTATGGTGGILKDTTAGLGGYTTNYKPQAGGSVPEKDVYNSGAGICFDCHMTQNSGTKPWGYQNTYGATQGIFGYFDTPYFAPGLDGPQQRYAYKASDGLFKAGHLGASSLLSKPASGTIGGLCTPCHDPHGVSPSLGTNQQYAVPLLKGTWMTSPYKEDAAPAVTNELRGCDGEKCKNDRFSNASTPGYHIDQNTFANWSYTSTASVSQTDAQFAGLCLQCHPKSSLSPDTSSSWRSVDRIHNAVKGWDNDGSTMHRYTCSKCHSPHTSTLGRLLVTNCLDSAHRGRVATGGTVPPNQSGSGEEGNGSGRFPAGGGGIAYKNDGQGSMQGPFFFGTTSGGRACHDNENSFSYPDNQLWNVVSPWGDLAVDCSSYSSQSSCNANSSCQWDSNRRQCNQR